jgi:lysophospholipid hydrolase
MWNYPYVYPADTVIRTAYRIPQELKASTPKPAVTTPQNPAAVVALKHLKDRVQSEIQKYRGSRPDVRAQRLPRTDDFARLARRICGVSIGLVLGGGGARGISHLVSHLSLPHADLST